MNIHPEDRALPKYSVLIPVFNSAQLIEKTVERTVSFFEKSRLDYEIVLVNDGSPDESWDVLRKIAAGNPRILAVNLLRNYGQHTALFCGLKQCTGDFVVTMDDDLQNPPEEIEHLIEGAKRGHDLVIGKYQEKKHPWFRRFGSKVIGRVDRRIFRTPKGLALTNFRLIKKDVVSRMCAYRTSYPYISGLAAMFALNPTNVEVRHQPRPQGKSQYSPVKLAELVMRILFNYSAFPLRVLSVAGIVISSLSFLVGMYFLGKEILVGIKVPGWTTVVVLLAFLNGLTILMISMLGEYTVRMLHQTSSADFFQIKEVIRQDD